MKHCTKCNKRKSNKAFSSDASKGDGLYPYCLECQRAYHRTRRKRRKHAVSVAEKTCAKCSQEKIASEFSTNPTNKDGLHAYCHTCAAETRRRRYLEHSDYYKSLAAKRRAIRRGARVETNISRKEIWERDGGICQLCFSPVLFEDMHLDHKVPLSRGGSHSKKNTQVAHSRCNLRKHAKVF